VAGAVFVPRRASLFSAWAGGGAWLRSGDGRGPAERLWCNAGVPLDQALVATGFGYEADRRRGQGRVLSAVLPRVRDIRRGGSCAVDLCSLAAGNVDAYYERGVHYWDIAAGGLIASEAGAVVAGLSGKPAGSSMTVGAGPGLFAVLHDLLVSLDPERDS
jgi:myo-inositol-1(or 4)-monophosphatase